MSLDIMKQALEALEAALSDDQPYIERCKQTITTLRAALAEPEEGGNLPPPLQKPGDFDHAIGADRFKVVRGAFWWHVLIGDSPTKRGKFHTQAGAEEMAAVLLREFRNGAFVQHEAALAEPVQEPVAWMLTDAQNTRLRFLEWQKETRPYSGEWIKTPLYTSPPQCKPLTEEEIKACEQQAMVNGALPHEQRVFFARAIEQAHGIE